MAKSTNLNFTQDINNPIKRLNNASGTTPVAVYTVPADDAVLKALIATSTDTAVVNLQVFVSDGTTDALLGTVRIPAGSGNDGATPSVDILGSSLIPGLPVDMNNRRVLPLAAGKIIKVAPLVAITAGKQMDLVPVSEEY